MKTRVVQKNYFRELVKLKKRLFVEFSWLEGRNLVSLMSGLGHYHYNKKNQILLGNERLVYDFLMRTGFNPYTVYRWLLLERIPEDIKYQLKNNKLSQTKAISLAFKRRQETTESIGASVQELGLVLIRRM